MISQTQQKANLVERALSRLNLGLLVLTPDGKVRLATPGAVQQLTKYLGDGFQPGNRLPDSLWRWIRQQKNIPNRVDDISLPRTPLILERERKRLVMRLVSDLDQILLLLEEQPTTIKYDSVVPFGLSRREAQVLVWVARGKTNKEIGVILE